MSDHQIVVKIAKNGKMNVYVGGHFISAVTKIKVDGYPEPRLRLTILGKHVRYEHES